MLRGARLAFASACCALLAGGTAGAQQPVTFKGQTLALVVDASTGGGTDLTARLLAPFLTKYLPGNPAIVVRNLPGAEGLVALNYLVQQVKPDGMTLVVGGGPSIDPIRYRDPQSHYDPGQFEFVGGVGRGGSVLIINSGAEKRLYDKSAPPVAIGIAGAAPRSGQLMAAWAIEFLGWNARWIAGYRATVALMQALQQGEIDMTATSSLLSFKDGVESGRFKVILQSGGLHDGKRTPRPEFPHIPLLADQLAGKITSPVAKQAFQTWQAVLLTDKFIALPPKTPAPIVSAYRAAYDKIMADPEFSETGRKLSEVFEPLSSDDVNGLVKDIVATPNEAVDYVNTMLRHQGIH
jgi:tripartite-type tricarboxylate transporter receptor subunit TctC